MFYHHSPALAPGLVLLLRHEPRYDKNRIIAGSWSPPDLALLQLRGGKSTGHSWGCLSVQGTGRRGPDRQIYVSSGGI